MTTGASRRDAGQGRDAARRRTTRKRLAVGVSVALVIVIGFGLRLWRLGSVPYGFHVDEGHYALDALEIARGWRPVFLPGNNGREPLFAYLMALPLWLVGPSIWGARLAGVVAGTLFLPAQLIMSKRLPLPGGYRPALIACALAAVTFWPVSQARYALRAGLLPLWVALLLWAWWRALEPAWSQGVAAEPASASTARAARRRLDLNGILLPSALAGMFLAAAAYTHLAGRLLPITVLISALWVAWRARRREPIVAMAIALAVAGVLVLPLVGYFVQNPGMLAHRADQVSVLNPQVHQGDLAGTLLHNGRRLLEMPFVRGDTSWYHNLRDRPVFDPIMGLFFLLGSCLICRDLLGRKGARVQSAAVLLATTLALMLATSWLSVGAPNYVRLTGTWPFLFLIAAYGLDRSAVLLERTLDTSRRGGDALARPRMMRHAGSSLIVLCVIASALWSTWDYFGRYAGRPEAYHAFNGPAVERSRIVLTRAADRPTYVSPSIWRQAVMRFLLADAVAGSFDLTSGLVWPPGGGATYAFEASETEAIGSFAQLHPGTQQSDITDGKGTPSVVLFQQPVTDHLLLSGELGVPAPAVFGQNIELTAASLWRVEDVPTGLGDAPMGDALPVRPGEAVTVALAFRVLEPTRLDHNLFVHVTDGDGHTVGQFDGPPLGGSYGTDRWVPGEVVLLPVPVRIDEHARPGLAEVLVGWYDWRTGVRLTVQGDDDAAVDLGSLPIWND